MEHRRYERAPIKEAIIDIRLSRGSKLPMSVFAELDNVLKLEFQVAHRHKIIEGQFAVAEGEPASQALATSSQQEHVGFR